mmetsp:Transcript_19979/g.67647  ORF Transcript_19979/g.67647 Transcript_19979/m.67647 type:complete len:229 (-) Transcript_19979:2141-2827(-)
MDFGPLKWSASSIFAPVPTTGKAEASCCAPSTTTKRLERYASSACEDCSKASHSKKGTWTTLHPSAVNKRCFKAARPSYAVTVLSTSVTKQGGPSKRTTLRFSASAMSRYNPSSVTKSVAHVQPILCKAAATRCCENDGRGRSSAAKASRMRTKVAAVKFFKAWTWTMWASFASWFKNKTNWCSWHMSSTPMPRNMSSSSKALFKRDWHKATNACVEKPFCSSSAGCL